ncbi:uncharacterized protein CMU_031690 [Cryptosporidium muris RN66]|uniref:Uncharacterized protein n=1 Tax=Cryptosporidium muris (strain RN66) TaxID=441375 RepID=B6AII7_CRYMR|nr:uncharacterized protein CMU_031690 [Cryptosporidium muris RN66]EEA08028.1 hypothetical protein, conserved [Cryptosporidium muris RN66]|eukprot:XP_002142377.1 hypothetical protein [Cryptosporidium muris RN66]
MKPYPNFTIFVFLWSVLIDPVVLEKCILNILETSLITIKVDNTKGKIGKNSDFISKINLSGFEDEDIDKPKENSDIEENNQKKSGDNINTLNDVTSYGNKSERKFKKKLSNIVASALGKSGRYSVNSDNKKSQLSKFKNVLRSKPSTIIPSSVPIENVFESPNVSDLIKTKKYLKSHSTNINLLHVKDIEGRKQNQEQNKEDERQNKEGEIRNKEEDERQNKEQNKGEDEGENKGERQNQEQDEKQNKGDIGAQINKLKLTNLFHKDIYPKDHSSSNKSQTSKSSPEYNLKCQKSKLDIFRKKLVELIIESKKRTDEIKKIKKIKDLHCRLYNFKDNHFKCKGYQSSMDSNISHIKIIKQKKSKIEEYISKCLELFIKQLNLNYELEFSRGISPTKCEMEDIFTFNKNITQTKEKIILSNILSEKLNLKSGKCKKCLSKKFNNKTCFDCSLILEMKYKNNKENNILKKELQDLKYKQASCINYTLITEVQGTTESKT